MKCQSKPHRTCKQTLFYKVSEIIQLSEHHSFSSLSKTNVTSSYKEQSSPVNIYDKSIILMTKGIKRFYPDGQLIKIITFKLYIGGISSQAAIHSVVPDLLS